MILEIELMNFRCPLAHRPVWPRGHRVGGVSESVLIVCTANQCRSPLAEHLLRHALVSVGLDWTVESAGVYANPGRPIDPDVSAVLDELHVAHQPDWASRGLTASDIAQADLVLTAERAHRTAVVTLVPSAVSRTFTLLEFARILPAAPPTGPAGATTPAGLIRLAEAARVHAGPTRDADDLADPINQGRQRFRECAAQISRAVDRIVSTGASSGVRTRGR
jgi:protein-tyrosine phosphatase